MYTINYGPKVGYTLDNTKLVRGLTQTFYSIDMDVGQYTVHCKYIKHKTVYKQVFYSIMTFLITVSFCAAEAME